jgi:hypothetical protein
LCASSIARISVVPDLGTPPARSRSSYYNMYRTDEYESLIVGQNTSTATTVEIGFEIEEIIIGDPWQKK